MRVSYATGRLHLIADLKSATLFHGEFKEYFKNGETKVLTHFVDGKLDGEFSVFYSNGDLQRKRIFMDGILTGPFEEYYPVGNLKSKGEYFRGKKHGKQVLYFEDGTLENSIEYENGALEGLSVYNFKNGSVHKLESYEQNQLLSIKEFDQWGILTQLKEMKDGNLFDYKMRVTQNNFPRSDQKAWMYSVATNGDLSGKKIGYEKKWHPNYQLSVEKKW
ncbi:hypothetical protein MJH12_15820, partial [bacterium]|nr:hypothetical protein [bacterium]